MPHPIGVGHDRFRPWVVLVVSETTGLVLAHEVQTELPGDAGLWDVLVREKSFPEAVVLARELAKDFPANTDLPKFLERHSE